MASQKLCSLAIILAFAVFYEVQAAPTPVDVSTLSNSTEISTLEEHGVRVKRSGCGSHISIQSLAAADAVDAVAVAVEDVEDVEDADVVVVNHAVAVARDAVAVNNAVVHGCGGCGCCGCGGRRRRSIQKLRIQHIEKQIAEKKALSQSLEEIGQ
ncbi:unnamed protein product, partial [Mesorhabditis belari]|uniref:Uncharacterized protein n=1 Tax=Mesorhabditis belari TaxID=2138241 RepID=A0AAF3ET82_9BILA